MILKDVLYADLLAVLNFMYHGEVLILKDQLPSFLQTAEVLQVSGLVGCGNFHIKNVITQKQKVLRTVKPKEAIESVSKKQKLNKKSKSAVSSPNASFENMSHSPKDFSLKPTGEAFEVVCVDKIKMEVEEENHKSLDKEKKVEGFSPSSDMLQPSILERSLMSLATAGRFARCIFSFFYKFCLGKPGNYVEHGNVSQLAADLTKNIHIPKKPPESHETEKIIPDHILTPTLELTETYDERNKTLDTDTLQMNPSEVLVVHDIPHHSSQCGTCPHCGKIYSNQSALKYHVRLVHSDLTNMYCCHLCPEAFDYRESYKRHMVDLHNVRN